MKLFLRALLLVAFLAHFSLASKGQGLCFNTTISTGAGAAGDTVSLQLRAAGFIGISSFQWVVKWDSSALELVHFDQSNSALESISYTLLGVPNGQLRMNWYDQNATGVSLTDGSLLFEMKFKILTATPGFYKVEINPELLPVFEVVMEPYTYMPFAHVSGGIRVGGAATGGPGFSNICISPATCNNSAGAAYLDMSSGEPPISFFWTGPNGFVSNEEDLNGVTPGTYNLAATDNSGAASNLIVTIPGSPGFINLAIDSVTQSYCGYGNGCIAVHPFTGTPPFSYVWSDNGPAQNARCDFEPGDYTLTVSDANGCTAKQEFSIGSVTTFTVELDSLNADCRFGQKGAIQMEVSGGVAPYIYVWSNGSTVAEPDSLEPGTYSVTVTDALGCSSSKSVTVRDYGTFDWTLYGSSSCNDPVDGRYWKVTGVDFANRVAFPLKLEWSTGTVQVFDALEDNLYAGQFHLPEGVYHLKVSDADGCTAELSKTINCNNQLTALGQKGPYFEFENGTAYHFENGQWQKDSCAVVVGYNLLNVSELHFGVEWFGEEIKFTEVKYPSYYLPGISLNNLYWEPGSKKVNFDWVAPEGESIAHQYGIDLFSVCFDTMVTQNSRWVGFADSGEPASVRMNNGAHAGFIGRSFSLRSEENNENKVCNFDLQLQDCANDGAARIHVVLCGSSYWNNNVFLHYNEQKETDYNQLLFAKPGTYKLNPASGEHSWLFARIPNYTLAQSCIWPGDADNNNTVNHFDVMYLVYGNYITQPRPNASLDWVGQDAISWGGVWGLNETSLDNIDTNGDGEIDMGDTVAIVQNYNLSVNPLKDNPYALPGGASIEAGEQMRIQSDTVWGGLDVNLPVYLDSLLPDYNDVFVGGFAFSVSYDTTLFPEGLWFEPSDVWHNGQIHTDANMIQRCFKGQQRLDVGVGVGYFSERADTIVGYLHGKVVQADQSGTQHAHLHLSNAVALINYDELVKFDPVGIDLTVIEQSQSTEIQAAPKNSVLRLSPNPAVNYVQVELPAQSVSGLQIIDLNGKVRFEKKGPLQAGWVQIPVQELPAGQYSVRVQTESGVLNGRFIRL